MIKTAMTVAAMFALLGTAHADVCVPVDAVGDCDKTSTNGPYSRSCRTASNIPTPGSFFIVLRTSADAAENYTVHFGGFDVDACTGGTQVCNEVTSEGDLYINGEIPALTGTTQRVRVSRVTDAEVSLAESTACQLGLTITR